MESSIPVKILISSNSLKKTNEGKLLNLHLLTIFTKPFITLFGFKKFDIAVLAKSLKVVLITSMLAS